MLTIACVFVQGHVPFTAEYVAKLHGMVSKYAGRPHRFVCLTDRPGKMPKGVEAIQIPGPGSLYGWWSKLHLFSAVMPQTGRVLYLDLDTLIVQSLEPVIDYPAPFALIPHAGNFQGLHGRRVVKRFNSSVMAWDAGTLNHLFDQWTPAVAKDLWGDQDYIGERCPDAATMPASWFPRLSEVQGPPFGQAKVILSKHPKNHKAVRRYAWFGPLWSAA